MNLKELRGVLDEGFMRTDLEHRYDGWIRRALRKIQDDHDWSPCRDTDEVTIHSGGTTASLPADMKALARGECPVFVRNTANSGWQPCSLVTEETAIRRNSYWTAVPDRCTSVSVVRDRGGRTLQLASPASETLVFRVVFFRYLPNLVAETDENFLTADYEDMVEHRVLATAFARINGFEAEVPAHEAAYLKFFREAQASDMRSSNQGRPLRMGG